MEEVQSGWKKRWESIYLQILLLLKNAICTLTRLVMSHCFRWVRRRKVFLWGRKMICSGAAACNFNVIAKSSLVAPSQKLRHVSLCRIFSTEMQRTTCRHTSKILLFFVKKAATASLSANVPRLASIEQSSIANGKNYPPEALNRIKTS